MSFGKSCKAPGEFFLFPFLLLSPSLRLVFFFALIKKEVKIEGAIVLSWEKNGAVKINRLMPREGALMETE